jgi:DNA-binding PadR family transcriptional regulator
MPNDKSPSHHGQKSDKHAHRKRHGKGRHRGVLTDVYDERTRVSRRDLIGRRSAGRVFGPGDLRLILLALIAEKPRYGYELIKEVEHKFDGTYSPSPGSVYPTLTLLEEIGHARVVSREGAKRLFEITAEGREFLAENKPDLDGITARMGFAVRAMAESSPPSIIFQAMHTLQAALLFHCGEWSEKEARRVSDILDAAAEAIGGFTRER